MFLFSYGEALAVLGEMLAAGTLAWKADIVDGLANAPLALQRLFDGSNDGKLLVRVAPAPAKL